MSPFPFWLEWASYRFVGDPPGGKLWADKGYSVVSYKGSGLVLWAERVASALSLVCGSYVTVVS